jgi:heme/copper-type cytochrome/quinol oxidase subunit 3
MTIGTFATLISLLLQL